MNIHKLKKCMLAVAVLSLLNGCSEQTDQTDNIAAASGNEAERSIDNTIEVPSEPYSIGIMQLTPEGAVIPRVDEIPVPEEGPAPEYLRNGVDHSVIAQLQARLMELGFMDNDEPTQHFGGITEAAVKAFQRQNDLDQDGIAGPATWEAIMDPEAKYYAVSNGDEGSDIKRIQNRLYELGYLASSDLITGTFGDTTEAAVLKLQELNGIAQDGKVGRQTINLIYSDEVRPNYISYGEKSDIVLQCQNRLKELGYLSTTPDGTYGEDTIIAVKQFQSRNDLVVDGYLGPSTKIALMEPSARPNGITLGERGDSVHRVQELLSKFGYLSSANVTGYFGEVTENAVKEFQAANGLAVDGSVGRMTMNKLAGNDVKKASGSRQSQSGGSSGKTPENNNNNNSPAPAGSGAGTLISVAQSKIGSPYVYGAKGAGSFDCSGFVYWCLNQAGVRQSYITSSGWRNVGKYTKISNFSDIRAGDIVVVNGHVGIAAGGGQVIDASSSHGRVVQRPLSSWWAGNFICAWRIFG